VSFRSASKSDLLPYQGWEKVLQPTSAGVYKWGIRGTKIWRPHPKMQGGLRDVRAFIILEE